MIPFKLFRLLLATVLPATGLRFSGGHTLSERGIGRPMIYNENLTL